MKIFRISNLLLLCVAAALGTVLFWTSQAVQQAEDTLAEIQLSVRQERESIRVLATEWDYLNRPQRLEELAAQYLRVKPADSAQFIESAGEIPVPPTAVIPPAKPALYAQPVSTQPRPAAKPPIPSEYIKASEKKSFERLIQTVGGDE